MSHINKRVYIERDSRGRERLVMPRSLSGDRRSTRDLLIDSENRYAALQIEYGRLQARLSFKERNNHALQQQYDHICTEHYRCHQIAGERDSLHERCRRLEDALNEEEQKNEELKEKNRLLKRGVSRTSHESDDYKHLYKELRDKYAEKIQEVELLRVRIGDKDQMISLHEGRVAEKDRLIRIKNEKIVYFKEYLRAKGFRVSD